MDLDQETTERCIKELCRSTVARVQQAFARGVAEAERRQVWLSIIFLALFLIAVAFALLVGFRLRPDSTQEPGEPWSLEATPPITPDAKERFVLTVRRLEDGNPGWYPKDGKRIAVPKGTAIRLRTSTELKNLIVKLQRADTGAIRTLEIPWNKSANKEGCYILNGEHNLELFLWISQPIAFKISPLSDSSREIREALKQQGGEIQQTDL